ncbi:MAG TPA: hypothetical protein VNS58_17380 [Puia sp.]|nr:hypothetical protein [Puia sp.]
MNKNSVEASISLIDSINALISLNRCSFSAEDLELLRDCISKLKIIDSMKSDIDKCEAFVEVVARLDKFLCSDNVQRFFDVIS